MSNPGDLILAATLPELSFTSTAIPNANAASLKTGSHPSQGTRTWWRPIVTSGSPGTRSIVSGPTSSPATGRRNGSKHSSGAYFGSTRSFPEPVRLSDAMLTDPELRTWVQFRKRESNWRPGLGTWLMTSAGQNW